LKKAPGTSEVAPKTVSTVKAEEPVAAEVKDESGTVQLDFRATLKNKADSTPSSEPVEKEGGGTQVDFRYSFHFFC
jgi:hypothetical protein